MNDRFDRLKKILQLNPSVTNLEEIKVLNSKPSSNDVSFIGIVKDKRETGEKRHIKLVLEVIEDWDWKPWYPNQEQLKRTYSREGFTPETRHYV